MSDNLGSSEPLLEDLEGQGVWQNPPQLEASRRAGGGGRQHRSAAEGISASRAAAVACLLTQPSCTTALACGTTPTPLQDVEGEVTEQCTVRRVFAEWPAGVLRYIQVG